MPGIVCIRNFAAHSPEITDDYWISGDELTVAITCIKWLPFYIRLIWETYNIVILKGRIEVLLYACSKISQLSDKISFVWFESDLFASRTSASNLPDVPQEVPFKMSKTHLASLGSN